MIDRFAFTAMTGAKHSLGQLATTSNNLANAQTPGFREMLSTFRAVPVRGASADSRAFVVDATPGADWTPGAVTPTGNPLDLAIQGEGMFAVQRADGQEGYTRAGRFHQDPLGRLVTMAGHAVLDSDGKSIQLPADTSEIQIDAKGMLRAVLPGQSQPADVAQLKLVNPWLPSVTREPDGLFVSSEPQDHQLDVRIVQGAIESSNVNVAQAMVQMIAQNRMFDLNIRLVQLAEQNAKTAGSLMSLSRV